MITTISMHLSTASVKHTPVRPSYLKQSTSGLKTLITHAVFLDFAKAFDSVPHERLLLKLDHMGVRGELFRWMKAFLSNRQQRVLCNGCPSTWSRVVSGVPQGSILGPLLFLIYVNDIGDNLTSHSRLFADDCVIYREISESSGCSTMQEDLVRVYEWTQKWQLALNLSKCKAIICISNKRRPAYRLNNVAVEWVDTFKYLGVRIHPKLR